jgi:lysophospholipase L1-like esterase
MKIPNFVACLGDSTTQGSDSTSIPYPVALQALLNATYPGTYAVSNRGTGGAVVAGMSTAWSGDIKGKVSASVPSKRLVVFGGINDVIVDTGAATIFAALKVIYDDALASGWLLIPITITPFHGYTGWTSARQAVATTINASILSYCTANALTAVDGYALLGDAADPTQLSYQGGTKPDYATKTYAGSGGGRDFLHPNDAGHAALAAAIKTAIGV